MRSNVTVDLGLRWEYYTPLAGLEGAGSLSNYDPATHTLHVSGFGDTDEALNVKKKFTNFSPRTGVSWRINEKNVVRAGYGASTIPFPDNRYAFNYPVKQTYAGTAVNGFQPAGSMATGFPPPALLDIPSNGIIPVSGVADERDLRRHPEHASRGHAPIVERRLPAPAAVPADGGHRLRRQPRRRPRDGRRRQRQSDLRIGQQRPAGVLDSVPAHRHQPHAHQLEQVRPTTGCR